MWLQNTNKHSCPLSNLFSPNQVLTHAARAAASGGRARRARRALVRVTTCCPLVRFPHIESIKDAARDGPCAHGKVVQRLIIFDGCCPVRASPVSPAPLVRSEKDELQRQRRAGHGAQLETVHLTSRHLWWPHAARAKGSG